MSTLTRKDGSVFAIQVYRERLKYGRPSSLRQALRSLADEQGDYMRIFPLGSGEHEVVLSRDMGFLLGETLCVHFKGERDVIYCEVIDPKNTVLLVVIRDGGVHLDVIISPDSIWNELLPIVAEKRQYRLYYYGGLIPIEKFFKHETIGELTTQPLFKNSVTLTEPLIDQIPCSKDFQLLPSERAIQVAGLSFTDRTVWVGVLIIIVCLGLGYWHWGLRPQETATGMNHHTAYGGFIAALRTPDPELQLLNLIKAITAVNALPNVSLSRVDYGKKGLTLHLHEQGGHLLWLRDWAKQQGFSSKLNNVGLVFSQRWELSPRKDATKIFPAQAIFDDISDQMRLIQAQYPLSLKRTTRHHHWQQLQCEWRLQEGTVADLSWLASVLKGLPVTLGPVSLVEHNHQLAGKIEFSIWGS